MYTPRGLPNTRRAALQELRGRAVQLHAHIEVIEQQQAALAGQRSVMAEDIFLQRMAIFEQEIARKRVVLAKWNKMVSDDDASVDRGKSDDTTCGTDDRDAGPVWVWDEL